MIFNDELQAYKLKMSHQSVWTGKDLWMDGETSSGTKKNISSCFNWNPCELPWPGWLSIYSVYPAQLKDADDSPWILFYMKQIPQDLFCMKFKEYRWSAGCLQWRTAVCCELFDFLLGNNNVLKVKSSITLQLQAIWRLIKHPIEVGFVSPFCSLSWQAGRRIRKRGQVMTMRQVLHSLWPFGGHQAVNFSGQSIQTWMSLYQSTWIHTNAQIWTSFTCQSRVLWDR